MICFYELLNNNLSLKLFSTDLKLFSFGNSIRVTFYHLNLSYFPYTNICYTNQESVGISFADSAETLG